MVKDSLLRLFVCLLLFGFSVSAKGQLDRESMDRARMKSINVKVCEQYTHKYVKCVPKENG